MTVRLHVRITHIYVCIHTYIYSLVVGISHKNLSWFSWEYSYYIQIYYTGIHICTYISIYSFIYLFVWSNVVQLPWNRQAAFGLLAVQRCPDLPASLQQVTRVSDREPVDFQEAEGFFLRCYRIDMNKSVPTWLLIQTLEHCLLKARDNEKILPWIWYYNAWIQRAIWKIVK